MKKINLALLIFEILLYVLFWTGTPFGYLAFGYGLGDVFIVFFTAIYIFIHSAISMGFHNIKIEEKYYIIPISIF